MRPVFVRWSRARSQTFSSTQTYEYDIIRFLLFVDTTTGDEKKKNDSYNLRQLFLGLLLSFMSPRFFRVIISEIVYDLACGGGGTRRGSFFPRRPTVKIYSYVCLDRLVSAIAFFFYPTDIFFFLISRTRTRKLKLKTLPCMQCSV